MFRPNRSRQDSLAVLPSPILSTILIRFVAVPSATKLLPPAFSQYRHPIAALLPPLDSHEEMSENDAIADGTSDADRSLSDQADPYSDHIIFMASSEESNTNTDASASDVSMDEEPGAPPPSHVATDEELLALEREVFDYNPSVGDSWYTTDDDSDANSEMSDIPAPPVPHSPCNFPLHEIRDLDVDVIIDPRLQYNPFRFFPAHTLPVIPPANPPSLLHQMFESVFIDLVDLLRHLLAMLSAGQPIYHQIDVVEFTLNSVCDWFYVYQAFK
ncbi:hypothetical protein PGT21_013370 [Puccinia graminis f. sp. tritici]|uniref:Uncharacterized protein n=1 Tax=Puccinia graminis f. sp. tritici TaxID=56615 RepID=A0A5B0LVP9_PUCGR|nr:hypothetical protein PGT21_013370 [Puccinia graminis f. sp. tritici]